MTELRLKLLEVYSAGPTADVHDSLDYKELCSKYKDDPTFDGERLMVEELRFQIDRRLMGQASFRDQVDQALRLLRKLDSHVKKKACRDLILKTYGAKWEAKHRRYFEEKAPVMMEALDYFLSFTNRNLTKGLLNQINRNHQYFIIESIGREAFEKANLNEQNLVAETVNYYLANRRLKGFYYPKHEGDNTSVKQKLSSNCCRALAFVQLVQTALFNYVEESPNWCLFEYMLARQQATGQILFVQIEDNIPANNLDLRVEDWFNEASTVKDSVKLKEARWPEPQIIETNRLEIYEKLFQQIERARDRIYLEIPN